MHPMLAVPLVTTVVAAKRTATQQHRQHGIVEKLAQQNGVPLPHGQ
jgi:hypothetical protein